MSTEPETALNVAEARRRLSQLLERTAYQGESFIIMRRGRPMAKLVPLESKAPAGELCEVGWLDEDDPFFEAIDRIVADREGHRPRVLSSPGDVD